VAEIARALQDRCAVTQTRIVDELARIGFSDIVSWRNEIEVHRAKEDGQDQEVRVLSPRVTVVDSETLTPELAATVSHVSQEKIVVEPHVPTLIASGYVPLSGARAGPMDGF